MSFGRSCKFVFLILSLTPLLSAYDQRDEFSAMIGDWECRGVFESAVLVFFDERVLQLNGQRAYYELAPGVIKIQGEYGRTDYPYSIAGGQLSLTLPDGTWLECVKRRSAPGKAVVQENPGKNLSNYSLRGALCKTPFRKNRQESSRFGFDGFGKFTFADQKPNGLNVKRGTYKVTGDEIALIFEDGAKTAAFIRKEVEDRRITAVEYNGDLYALENCE